MTLTIDEFRAEARCWLADRLPARDDTVMWGSGSDDVSVFHDLDVERERALLAAGAVWQSEKLAAGYGAVTWPCEFGGRGLTSRHERAFVEEESTFAAPASHELLRITVNLAAPTLRDLGTASQRDRFVPRFLACRDLACQLFSEPGAGSDLAGLATRAARLGDNWVVDGAKVWASGAQFSSWGLLLARTDPDVPKHRGMTAFLLDMSVAGVDVRPIRQMSGGASFNEVFLSGVHIDDGLRVGAVGEGWGVARTVLAFERAQSGSKREVGGSWEQLRALAEHTGATSDPLVRQRLAGVYAHERVREWTRQRATASRGGDGPGPEGSLGKLLWTQGLTDIGEVAAAILGPRLVADSGAWGTYAWSRHVLGAPGYQIAGGSDEIQRTIIAERVLGLPPDPRADAGPWRTIPR